jgi:hypothetical protein
MANIGIRSPYFIYDTLSGQASAKIEISIDSTLRYTIVKNTGTTVRLDISELVRDYVTPTYNSAGSVPVSAVITFYTGANAAGTPTVRPAITHTAYDGYGYFSEGENFDFGDGVLLSGDAIWLPENTAGSFYRIDSGSVSSVPISTSDTTAGGVTVKRQPCDKYDPIRVIFINKFGVPQDLYFFAKKVDSVTSSGENYLSSAINMDGSYSVTNHQVVSFNKNAKRSYSLSTGYVSEAYNNYIQELMLSEQVWMVVGASVMPVTAQTSNVQFKTSLNDKLVAYTVDFEEANDLITTIR